MNNQYTFFNMANGKVPLAEELRPKSIENVLGQSKLLAENSILANMISTQKYSSFILWGPPGCGKTTIARIIQNNCEEEFVSFSAVFSKIADVKKVMHEAEFMLKNQGKATIIFVDEIHRFNKSQQDAFLPFIESGAVILIGATTENPSFEVISALLSRCHVFVLNSLEAEHIVQVINNALLAKNKESLLDENAKNMLANLAEGDARKALNYVEILLNYNINETLNADKITELLNKKQMRYDKNAEEHYNLISALHKSLRGSDAQAGLYWLARMLEAGENPMYVARRLVRFATEDIGLADPNAVQQAIACKDAVHFLGMPEANTPLAQLVVYLATAPKSNSAYMAYKFAAVDAQKTSHLGPPMHIRNAPTQLMKDLGYNKGYVYSHDAENSYHYQKYFPDNMEEKNYYEPSKFGFEKEIEKRLSWWQKLKENQLKNPKD